MPQRINILLLVEDDESDIIITKRKISKTTMKINELITCNTLQETKEMLKNKIIDIVLLDLNLPDSQGLNTLLEVKRVYDGIIIVLTSIDDEQVGIEAIRAGADDYLVKSHLDETILVNGIYHSKERRKRWENIDKAQQQIQQLDVMLNKEV